MSTRLPIGFGLMALAQLAFVVSGAACSSDAATAPAVDAGPRDDGGATPTPAPTGSTPPPHVDPDGGGDGQAPAAPADTDLPLASPSEHDVLRADVDGVVAPYLGGTTAYAIGFVLNGKRYFYGYGPAAPQGGTVDDRSYFEIGSVGKTFLGTVLAQMVVEGKVGLDDPLDKELPPIATAPERAGQKITLLDLATHYSGLPRDADPSVLSTEDLLQTLGATTLLSTPGTRYLYSNLGASVLGDALANVHGASWDHMVDDRVLVPYGMVDSGILLPAARVGRWVQSYSYGEATTPTPNNGTDPEGPSGGTFSTARDMTRFVAAQMGLIARTPTSPTSLALARTAQRASEGGRAIGLFWDLDVDAAGNVVTVSKDGDWNGFHTNVEFSPTVPAGVVLLGNTLSETSSADGQTIADSVLQIVLAKSP